MPAEATSWVFQGTSPLRLDRFLADQLTGISRSYIQDLIVQGIVRVNGIKARKGHLLNEGDRVDMDSFARPEEREIEPSPDIPLHILWQSSDFLVVDKPAGLPTHPNDFSDRNTLANALLARFPAIGNVGDDRLRPGIVHRLDTDTSGLLLIARTQETFRVLRKLFDERKIQKTYVALVLGDIEQPGEIRAPLAHHPKNPRKMVAVKEGTEIRSRPRDALTLYEPIERFGLYTLLKVQTKSGRMHQIRVHLSSIGHPLAGDRLYQTSQERSRDSLGMKRHFLHATEIKVPIPSDPSPHCFENPVAAELQTVLEQLRHRP
ncbi:MAG TPA: RluA family pseudouridine synthase [Bdellovibrionota bacterium]|nr:RluA family pseudouridine synthase [Bdellovibrionota bacterium]